MGVDALHHFAGLLPEVRFVAHPGTIDVATTAFEGVQVHMVDNLLGHVPGVDQHLINDHLYHWGTLAKNILTCACKNNHYDYTEQIDVLLNRTLFSRYLFIVVMTMT